MKEYWKENKTLRLAKKKFNKLEYRGVKMWPLILPRLYYLEGIKQGKNIGYSFSWIKSLAYFFLIKKINLVPSDQDKIWATYFPDRKDHRELFYLMLNKFSLNELSILNNGKYVFKIPSIKKILFSLKFVREEKIKDLGYLHTIKIASLIYFYLRQIDFFKESIEKFSPLAHIAFNSSENADENIITQILNGSGKQTFLVQHSSVNEYSSFDEFRTYYDMHVAKNQLVWGQKSSDIIHKLDGKRKIIIVGNPKQSIDKIKTNDRKELRKGILILNSNSFLESNLSILNILNKFNLDVDVKMHPYNNIEDYAKYLNKFKFLDKEADINKVLENYDFVILQNTGVSLEVLSRGIPRFRFLDSFTIDRGGPKDFFSNGDDLKFLIEKYSQEKDFKELMGKYLIEFKLNFYQPLHVSISEYYREKIMEIINEK